MTSAARWLRSRCPAIAFAAGLLTLSFAPALADDTRHHLAFGVGYYGLTSDHLHRHFTTLTGEPVGDIDLRNAVLGLVRYGYSLTPLIDLTLEGRRTYHEDSVPTIPGKSTLKTSWIGPGVRVHVTSQGFRPYAQTSLFSVHEDLKFGSEPAISASGVGFGVFAGAEIPASDAFTIPMEIGYTYGQPEDDVSGVGGSVGLSFNFGAMP